MGGVLFIDEAYYLHRPENEKDYGQEAIEILLQVMENQREDLVVILAGYRDRMETFFSSNPGFRSRIAHHIDFPDYDDGGSAAIAEVIAEESQYRLVWSARGDGRIRRAPAVAAQFRQCPFDPQRDRPGAATAGDATLQGRRCNRSQWLNDDRSSGYQGRPDFRGLTATGRRCEGGSVMMSYLSLDDYLAAWAKGDTLRQPAAATVAALADACKDIADLIAACLARRPALQACTTTSRAATSRPNSTFAPTLI